MEIAGQTSMVTGAARRIGRSIALALANAGSDIVLHYRHSHSDAEELARQIRKMGRKAWTFAHNLEDSDTTGNWFDKVSAQVEGIDILVNSASAFPEDGYQDLKSANLNRSMAIHLISPVSMIRSMYKQKRKAAVVNILDTRATSRDPLHVSYHLGKSALFTATKELAVEMAPQIRINAVSPGLILPPEGKGEEWIENLKGTNPLNTRGMPEDVADAVLFLCGADFVTGQIIYVDGGRHLARNKK